MSAVDQRNGNTFYDLMTQPNRGLNIGRYSTGLNLANPGTMGWASNYQTWLSNQPHVTRNLINILLEAPVGMQYLPGVTDDFNVYIQTLRSMVETKAISITGINKTLTAEVDSQPVGAGNEIFEVPVRSSRARSSITMDIPEQYGKSTQGFLDYWLEYLVMDPDTMHANIVTLGERETPSDMLADMYTATMCMFEPDALAKHIDEAYLFFNMFPYEGWERTSQRNKRSSLTVKTMTVSWTNIAQHGRGVELLAQVLLNNLSIEHANPAFAAAASHRIEPNVELAESGYRRTIDEIRKNNIVLNGQDFIAENEMRANRAATTDPTNTRANMVAAEQSYI